MRAICQIMAPVLLAAAGHLSVAQSADIEVDAQLFLAVDVSRSMAVTELEIQRRGYAAALASPDVVDAITSGMLGRIAVTYVEWAADHSQRVIVDWQLISNRQEADAFAAQLTASFNSSLRRTSISGAIDYASRSFDDNGYSSHRRIIDISGDGPNNQGRPVLSARHDALEKSIIINGLPLMTREGSGSRFHIDHLDTYYRECVIGGPGSFVQPVTDWAQFPAAVRQKLIQELVSIPKPGPETPRSHLERANAVDCLIGEKIWQRRYRDWDDL